MESSGNPKDVVRDHILRKLYEFNQKSRSPKKVAVLHSVLAKAMKDSYGYKLQEVASNLDYLIDKGYVKVVTESRTFTTPSGTTQPSERRTYKISAAGVDRLEEASLFQQTSVGAHVNITNINGVVNVGDGNVVNANFTDLSRVLGELRKHLASSKEVADETRLNVLSDIDGLVAQLQKPTPNPTVIRALWEGVKGAAIVGGAVDLVDKASHLIAPFWK
jgi:hypothetical protein